MVDCRALRADAAVAVHGINDCNILGGDVEIEAIQIVNDPLFRNRFRDDNYSALGLFSKEFNDLNYF